VPFGRASPVKGRATPWNPHPFGARLRLRSACGFRFHPWPRPSCVPLDAEAIGRRCSAKAGPALRWPCRCSKGVGEHAPLRGDERRDLGGLFRPPNPGPRAPGSGRQGKSARPGGCKKDGFFFFKLL